MKNNYCLYIIALIHVFCNVSLHGWHEIISPLSKVPGNLYTLEIIDSKSAWAVTFLNNDLERSLVKYHDNQWQSFAIPAQDPHLLATGDDGSLFIVARDENYKYGLWQLVDNMWRPLGNFDSTNGYPTNLIAINKNCALVAICPCRGSTQIRSALYAWDNNKLIYIPNVLNHNAMSITDEGKIAADFTITKQLSDNNSLFNKILFHHNMPTHTITIVVKNNSQIWAYAGNTDTKLYCWNEKRQTWEIFTKNCDALMKGSRDKKIYYIDKQNKLFCYN
ncbi:MAG: hypothetical protein ACOYT8_05380 [Candidatus Dependentiae bacterium]